MRLECPMPRMDFDIVTLGHGSGGTLMHDLLNRTVMQLFSNEFLDQQHDGASFEITGRIAFSTDSHVVSPLFFPGGDIGDLAVNGTVNDLAMCGASARYLSLAFILEEGLPMKTFWEVLLSIQAAASKADVRIVTGDTKVVEKGKGDGMFVNTSGVGIVHGKARIHHSHVRPGDRLVLSGPLASHGIAVMSRREGFRFETDIRSDTAPLKSTVMRMLDAFGESVRFLRDPTRGGLATTLDELAAACGYGMVMDQNRIPIDEQVEGACEMLGLDPLYVANEGVFLAVVQAEVADAVVDLLRNGESGSRAAAIGEVVREHPGKVVLNSRIGGKRVVRRLPGEQLPRIC